jgi:hypothetical protein
MLCEYKMSCGDGNRFVCGIKRMAKHAVFAPDKPTNAGLHTENEKRLSELLRLREQQDKGVFEAPNTMLDTGMGVGAGGAGATFEVPQFTPWTAPSAADYNTLKKTN